MNTLNSKNKRHEPVIKLIKYYISFDKMPGIKTFFMIQIVSFLHLKATE